ncbi:MAG TPA: NADH-quinone oxidoreductase subunit L, partial [Burkholderiaceae bacterium]|nr:NADH-quinone oxidoreductase subunit L [Burkholderiaceae bacterium]
SAPHESPAVVWVPLVLLAIASVIAGAIAVQPMVAGDYFAGAIFVDRSAHEAMAELSREFPGALDMALDGFTRLPFLLAAAGIAVAWLLYVQRPDLPEVVRARVPWLYRLLDHKYYLDQINEIVFAGGARWIGGGFWKQGDMALIDGVFVNGSARMVGRLAQLIRRVQSGFIYHYAFIMLVGVALMLFVFLTWPYLPALIADRR